MIAGRLSGALSATSPADRDLGSVTVLHAAHTRTSSRESVHRRSCGLRRSAPRAAGPVSPWHMPTDLDRRRGLCAWCFFLLVPLGTHSTAGGSFPWSQRRSAEVP